MADLTVYNTICKNQFDGIDTKLKVLDEKIELKLGTLDEKIDVISVNIARVEEHIFDGLSDKIEYLHKDMEDRRKAWRGAIIGMSVTFCVGIVTAIGKWVFGLFGG